MQLENTALNPTRHPKMSVVFLLYNAEKTTERLVQAILQQRHPRFTRREDWLEVYFMDDGSRDATPKILSEVLERAGNPASIRVIRNDPNLGLSGTLNKALKMIRSPYILTCHCDCFFSHELYVARMLELLENYPDAAAITGQPTLASAKAGKSVIPLAEKINLIANLMDLFPEERCTASPQKELHPVGFAEGRCDGFRVAALQEVGFYDSALRTAGEDQVLAARLRERGYQVYQAPELVYELSVSSEQDSLTKLIRHQHLFGLTHPYILLKNRSTFRGVVGAEAGANRQARTLLRALQCFSAPLYLIAGVYSGALLPLSLLTLWKLWLFRRHLKLIPLSLTEFGMLLAIQPFLDLSYVLGLVRGTVGLSKGLFWHRGE